MQWWSTRDDVDVGDVCDVDNGGDDGDGGDGGDDGDVGEGIKGDHNNLTLLPLEQDVLALPLFCCCQFSSNDVALIFVIHI